MNVLNSLVFDRSPTPMWVKDYSGVKTLVEQWQAQGITDLRSYFEKHPEQLKRCVESVNTRRVNRRTLELFGASDFDQFTQNLNSYVLPNFLAIYADLISQLAETGEFFVPSCLQYTLDGKAIYLQLRGYLDPNNSADWSSVLVATEDITSYKKALQKEEKSRKLAESLFNHSPAALLMENFNPIKSKLDHLRTQGITDLAAHLDKHPEFTQDCLNSLEIIDANQSALDILAAPNKEYLIENYDQILRHPFMPNIMQHHLTKMWDGELSAQQECIFVDLLGQTHHIYLKLTVLPDYEDDWGMVQVALTDITALKRAEQHLKHLSQHDSLTNLYNRTYYAQELLRLQHTSHQHLSCIFIDINGLKELNDQNGHEAGDQLIIATADLLKTLTKDTSFSVSRIGGDEFVVLMPNTSQTLLDQYIADLNVLIHQENSLHPDYVLSFSMGYTSLQQGESIKEMLHRADQLMYQHKKSHYQQCDRRSQTSS